jgi:hypothetical protein
MIEDLKEACDRVITDPALAPGHGVTHCNEGARIVARAMGCREFDGEGLLADDMVRIMDSNDSGRWMSVDGPSFSAHAMNGGLGFAAMSSSRLGEAHGHIAAGYPAPMQESGSLGKAVPMVANVGRQEGEEKVSKAFPVSLGEPDYYIWS